MALAFRDAVITFDQTTGQEQVEPGSATFNTRVNRAGVSIKGFDVRFNNGDHHLLRERIDVENVRLEGNDVKFIVRFQLRDNSGNFDDPYSGRVTLLVTADVA